MTTTRRRLDAELIDRGLFAGPEEARQAIEARLVLVDGAPARTPATLVRAEDELSLLSDRAFVSRGGAKLDGALSDLDLDPAGKRCLDAGAGHGGFTDCLLQRGAAFVVAVDVGYGQFDWRLRNDTRVELLERTNIRFLTAEATGGRFDLLVADLSFIGLTRVAGPLTNLTADTGSLLLMVKPQFEAKSTDVGEGGIVRNPAIWQKAIESVASRLEGLGFGVHAAAASRLKGAEGNQEFFLLAGKSRSSQPASWHAAIDAAVERAPTARDSSGGDPEGSGTGR